MEGEKSELSNSLDWTEFINRNKAESASILLEIKEILYSVNIFKTLAQITKMAFYVREDEDVYEHNITYNLRELPIIHFLCGLSLQTKEIHSDSIIKAEDLFNLINLTSKYLLKDSPYISADYGVEKEKQFVIQGHKQTMKMVRPLNPERYQYQTETYVRYIDNRISDIFVNKYGISPNNFLTIGKCISEYTLEKVNTVAKTQHLHPAIKQFLANPEADIEFMRVINQKTDEEKDVYFEFYIRYLFSLITSDAISFTGDELKRSIVFNDVNKNQIDTYLSLYCSKPGDQPLNSDVLIDNVLFSKPFINWNGVYYCPAPADIISALPALLEKLLEEDKLATPPTKTWDRFQKSKGYFVEDKAEEFFLRIFPKNCVFKNVLYEFNGNIEEADILIPYDDKLIIIQAKSGSLNNAARRGAENLFKNAIKKLVEDSYQQGVKVRKYIESNSNAVFKLRDTGEFAFARNPESRETTDYIFISLTLEPLGPLSARIKDLRTLDFFREDEYPVSMSIYDLDTITSLLPTSPSILIHYIKQRIISQNEGLFIFQDELSPFGWYLEHGCIKKPSNIEESITHISIDSDFLVKFDDYYLRKGERPVLMIEDEWINLIRHIEAIGEPGFSEITEQLLNISPEMRERLIKRIKEAFNKKYKKGVIGITSLGSILEPLGVTFVTHDVKTDMLNQILHTYSLLRKYQAKNSTG